MHRFYRGGDDAERRRFLAANNIRYVVYGPHEQSLGATPPAASNNPGLVYATPRVTIYEFDRRMSDGT
jgi:hypothetical protein